MRISMVPTSCRLAIKVVNISEMFCMGLIQADLLEVTYTTLHDDQSHTQIAQENALAVSFFTAGHVYGNPRISGTNTQDDVYTPFANILKTIAEDDEIQFGVLTGDMVFEPSVESYENLINALKTTAKPIYAAPGNHDLDGSGLFQSYFGSTYQSFTTAGNLFIVLTPGEDWALDPVQLAFLENTVENHKWSSDNIFIFTHQLFWLEMDDQRFPEIQPNSWANKNGGGNFWSAVKPIFSNYPGDVYFIAGDVGAFPDRKAVFYGRDGNLHFIASGMGGGVNDNILVVDAFADGSVVFDLIAINGDDLAALGDLGDW